MIKIKLHPLLILFCLALGLLGFFSILITYLITVVLHEFAHGFVAKKLGYKLNLIKLMPYGASLSLKSGFFNYKDEILVALAGPIANFVLAILGCALWWIEPVSFVYTSDFVFANIAVGLTNCLPIYPLDGGRILLALKSRKADKIKATKNVKMFGVCCAVAILVGFVVTVFFVPNYTLLVFGSFLFVSSVVEDNSSTYTTIGFLEGKQDNLSRGLIIRELAVDQSLPLYKLFSKVKQDSITVFCVVDSEFNLVGKISERQLTRLIHIYPAHIQLRQIVVK